MTPLSKETSLLRNVTQEGVSEQDTEESIGT
jgi:hypothetical protein